MDTSTAPWTPLTGLSATIKIKESPWGAIVVNDVAMTDIGDGWYEYVFTGYNPARDYTYTCNPWATAYIDSWVTDNLQQLISEIRGFGGWFSVNYSAINNHVTKKIWELRKDLINPEDITEIKTTLNEIDSHIELAKDETIGKIESIEIPEAKLEEKEAKKVLKIATGIDKKLTGYIYSEMKEKEEINQITAEFTKQEIEARKMEKLRQEEERKMKEEEKRKEEEEQKKEEELMKAIEEEVKAEFDKQEQMDKEEKKKELEKELEETLKEAEEIKKELNSIK